MKSFLTLFLLFFWVLFINSISLNAQSRFCQNPTQLCDNISLYPAGVGDGDASGRNNYDCLATQPNPAWFYFTISSGGSVAIDLRNTTVVDVDFVLYGPFNSLSAATAQCGNLGYGGASGNIVDCSYDPQPFEEINISNARAGEVYILLITNYSDAPTQVYTNPNRGSAEISCPCNYTHSFGIVNTPSSGGEYLGVSANNTGQYTVCSGDTLYAELTLQSLLPTDSLYVRGTGTNIYNILSNNEYAIYGPFQTNPGQNNLVTYQIVIFPNATRSGIINFSIGTASNRINTPLYCKDIANFSVIIPGLRTEDYQACSGSTLQLNAIGLAPTIIGNSNFTWRYISGTNVTFNNLNIPNPVIEISTYNEDISQPILLEVENAYGNCRIKDTVTITLQNNRLILPESPVGNCGLESLNLYAILSDTFAHTNACYPDYDLYAIDYNLVAGIGTTVSLNNDEVSTALPIGFPFQFYCNTYSNFYISSNGFISFSPTQVSGNNNTTIPNASTPNNLIALAWDDLDPTSGIGNIQYFTTGTSPNRKLIVSFTNVRYRGSNSKSVTGQIVLYETSNQIELHAQRIDNNNSGVTQGIENASGRTGIAVNGRNNGNFISEREGFVFIPKPGAAIPISPTYSWSPANTLSNANIYNPTATPTQNTVYVVTVTDGLCSYSDSIKVYMDSMPVDLVVIQPICNNNGSIIANTIAGQAPFTYQWSTGATTNTIRNLQNGIYTVTVTDISGCSGIESITLNSENLLDYTYTTTAVSCAGNGAINLQILNGQSPYSFVWNTGQTTQNITALNSGVYQVTIVDAAGCEIISDYIRVEENTSSIDISLLDLVNNLCVDGAIGSISVNVSGNNAPFTYQWSNGVTTTANNNLQQGAYWLTVTDANSCSKVSEIFAITSPDKPLINITTINPNCFGDNNGSISAEVLDTLLPLLYEWSNGGITNIINNLSANNTYTLTITNSANCVYEYGPYSLVEPAALIANAAIRNITCNGAQDGSINLNIQGGVLPYTYAWSHGASTQNLSALSSGNYTATITDKNGCIYDFPNIAGFDILEYASIEITIDSIHDLQCAESVDGAIFISVQGGLQPYNYSWSNGESAEDLQNLSANTYTLTLTDAANCIIIYEDAQLNIPLPIKINLDIIQGVIACDFSPIGAISASATQGIGNYSYAWSNGATTNNINNLSSDIFVLTVTDNNACIAIDSAEIVMPVLPQLIPYYIANLQADSCLFVGEIIQLFANDTAQNLVQYNWQQLSNNLPFALRGDTASFDINAGIMQAGNYTFQITASATTGNITCVEIDTLNFCTKDYYNLFLPTAFTPNGDSENDVYRPVELSIDYIKSFKIYNRWGNLVYDDANLTDGGWNGIYKGELQPREVYMAILEYQLPAMDKAIVYKTEFTLLR